MSDSYPSRTLDKFILRLPDGMRERIRDAAETNGRSMNAEIVHRLEVSFLKERLQPAAPRGVPTVVGAFDGTLSHADILQIAEAVAEQLLPKISEEALMRPYRNDPRHDAFGAPDNGASDDKAPAQPPERGRPRKRK